MQLSTAALVSKVEQLIERDLAAGRATLAQVAIELGLTERTLQRRLKGNGVSFKELVDRARVQRAREHLASQDLLLVEIAARLGYSEQSSFNRACLRWFSARPQACRQRLSQPDTRRP